MVLSVGQKTTYYRYMCVFFTLSSYTYNNSFLLSVELRVKLKVKCFTEWAKYYFIDFHLITRKKKRILRPSCFQKHTLSELKIREDFFFMKAVNFYIHIEHFISKENTVSVLYRKLINLIYYLQCK